MKDDIESRTMQIFPGKTPILDFKGWSTGSIICDYEIKFIEPLRTAAVSNKKENAKSGFREQFLENAKQMFKDMKNDDAFTNQSTTEVSKVICDGIDNTFVCDFSDQIRFLVKVVTY